MSDFVEEDSRLAENAVWTLCRPRLRDRDGDVDPDRGHLSGGVEHIGSGRRERFASEQEMPAFVARVLREEEGPLEQTGGT